MCIGLMLFTGTNLLLVHNYINEYKRSVSNAVGDAIGKYVASQMPDLW